MANTSRAVVAAMVADIAERFGLVFAESADGSSYSLLFFGETANKTRFNSVLGHLVTEHGVTHQFAHDSRLPGVYARGLTLPSAMTAIYLVVVGNDSAAEYVPLPPVTR